MQKSGAGLTFEVEGLVPARVERAPFDFRLEPVLLVGQQRHSDVRIGRAR